MINIVRYGSTAENNSWVLPEGMFSQDVEKNAVRVHDGVTPGGYEAVGVRAFTPPDTGPGSQFLVAGTMDAGFFGEVTSSELLTYEDLASQIGLSAGNSINNHEGLWLKFVLDGKILFIAKKPARSHISWNQIDARNAVREGGTPVTVGSHTFDVTLLRGASSDPTVRGADGGWYGYDIDLSNGSEWNRLMYPIHSATHVQSSHPANHTDSTADPFGSWANYTDVDLALGRNVSGRSTWTQEVSGDGTSYRVSRGYTGVAYLGRDTSSVPYANSGWRPCLRLVT